ncbi:hypothetical protein ACWDUM_25500 [Rhodococcus sp. NPDC003322]
MPNQHERNYYFAATDSIPWHEPMLERIAVMLVDRDPSAIGIHCQPVEFPHPSLGDCREICSRPVHPTTTRAEWADRSSMHHAAAQIGSPATSRRQRGQALGLGAGIGA